MQLFLRVSAKLRTQKQVYILEELIAYAAIMVKGKTVTGIKQEYFGLQIPS